MLVGKFNSILTGFYNLYLHIFLMEKIQQLVRNGSLLTWLFLGFREGRGGEKGGGWGGEGRGGGRESVASIDN